MTRQPLRVLFLPADARGLGHLSRAGKLAHAIRRQAACVIAAGRRDGRHLVPAECEYAFVPDRDAVLPFRIPEPGGPPAGTAPPQESLARRREFFRTLVGRVDPDVIVTDQYPTGLFGELYDVLAESQARRFMVLRPVPGDDGARAVAEVGMAELRRLYDRILVASDQRTALVDEDLGFGDRERLWCHHIGYVSLRVSSTEVQNARRQRGLSPQDRWIVCTVGSGFYNQSLIADCIQLSREFTDVHFDLVPGPGAPSGAAEACSVPGADGRVRVIDDRTDPRVIHAAADIVICHGGYNTLIETMEGGAALIVDIRGDAHHERARHVRRLQPHYPIACGEGSADLARHVRTALSGIRVRRSIRDRGTLDFDGCQTFARLVSESVERAWTRPPAAPG